MAELFSPPVNFIVRPLMTRESNQVDRSPDDLLKYPRFDEQEVTFRWQKDRWDGPLNGSISHRGDRYWFEFYCDTDEPGNPYFYLVFPLSYEEADLADSWSVENKRFQAEWVPLGNDPATKDLPATAEIAARWKAHDAHLPNYSDRQPVAWFMSGSNASFYGIQVH